MKRFCFFIKQKKGGWNNSEELYTRFENICLALRVVVRGTSLGRLRLLKFALQLIFRPKKFRKVSYFFEDCEDNPFPF